MEQLKQTAVAHYQKHKSFILYALIGVSGVTIDYLLFAAFTQVFGMGVLLANYLSISAGIINNFWLNSAYNFKKRDHLLKRFVLFYIVGGLGIVLSELIIAVLHYGLGITDLWAKLATLPFVLVFQFFLNKKISFGDIARAEQKLKRLFAPGRLK